MAEEVVFPKRLLEYLNETGVRALDRLADQLEERAADAAKTETTIHAAALASLVESWKTMPEDEKGRFVNRVTTSVVDVIIASAALPASLKLGKKAIKAGRKIFKKQAKRLRKASKKKTAAGDAVSKSKNRKPKPKPKAKAKAKAKKK